MVRRVLLTAGSVLGLFLLCGVAARADGAHRVCLPTVMKSAAGSTVELVFEFSQVQRPGQDRRELAVAFHSIAFLDAEARAMGELVLGTPQANALQGEGWWGNEQQPGVGPFQWAGSAARHAVLRLPIPLGCGGLLLHINSIADGMWMTVRLDGAAVARLPVDAYWHDGYVPVGATAFSTAPGTPPQWTAGRYFPAFSSSGRLYSIHVRSALENWWQDTTSPQWRINSSPSTMQALTLVGMQGVINRNGAAVFLDWEDRGLSRDVNQHWLSLARPQMEVIDLDLDGMSAFLFLYQRFAQRFQGAVVYDPQVPDTINLATMYAGLEERIILAPEQLGLPGLPTFRSVTDLRPLAQQEGWDATEEGKYGLYDWVYRNLWPRLDRRIVGVVSPGPPTSREIMGASGRYYPVGMASRDHLVALRACALWLSPLEQPQAALFERFVQEASAPPVVYGFFGNDEVGTVALASRNGGWCPALTNGNAPLAAGNQTVLAAVRPALQRYPAEIDPQRLLATLDGRPVMTLWSSDGDNIAFQIEQGFHGGVDFYWDAVQGRRFGWTTNPVLADLPLVWNDYVATRHEVSLVSGLSGCGYMYPALMSDAQLDAYLARARTYLGETGLRVLHLDNRYGPLLDALEGATLARYYQGLRDAGYLGAFVGGSGWPWGMGFYYAGAPTPAVPSSYRLTTVNRAAIIQDLLARRPGEYRVDPAAPCLWQAPDPTDYGWRTGQVVQDADANLGQSLRFSAAARPSGGLGVWGPFSALGPGTYDVTYRLKVADNRETRALAQLFVGVQEPAWRFITRRYVAPSEFARAGQYQDLVITFTLDRFTPNVEFRLDYYGGLVGDWASTDLFVDEIVCRRRGGLDLPVMAAVFIPLVGATEPLPPSLAIAEEFEAAGGLVLTPDEFMAALNPEYLIEFATPIVGANHPALVQARAQLRDGRYLESLLTLRGALRTCR